MANQKVIEQKEKEVKDLADKLKDAKIVLLTDYRGINVDDVTKMRAELRKDENTEYLVAKNSTLRFAVKGTEYEGISEKLEGPTAVVFSTEDYVGPAKILYDYAKDSEFYKIKGGIMDGKVIDSEEIIKLAKLPSKEMLLTQVATALLANIRNVAVVLDQVREQKEGANA